MRKTGTVRWTGVHARPVHRLVALPVAIAGMVFLLASVGRADSTSLTERQRFGFVATSADWRQEFNVALLRAGWYVDMTSPACDPAPEGMERAQVLKVFTDYTVNASQLGPLVDNHPGIMWLIGNEPDCIWQDDVVPEEYARIYHDLHTFIKGRDPTSQLSPGGIVQPTPLRLEYLDRVLAAYQAQYGEKMPVDAWNIHNAILNEQRGSWGAEIPPGINATEGEVRTVDDNDNMIIFRDQIWAFRQWMANRGYGGYPLIVTEYGILMPDDYGFDANRVNTFMSNTFDFFLSAADAALGDPNDGHRLVQRWAWFSLDVAPWNPITGEGFNGNLFDPETGTITSHGQHYAGHTSSFPPLNYADLSPRTLSLPPASELASPTQTITRSLLVEIENGGTVDSGGFTVTLAYDGPLSGELAQWVANVPPTSAQWNTFTLANLQPGGYDVSIRVDPDNRVDESVNCNNRVTATVLAPTNRLYLSQISGSGKGITLAEGASGPKQEGGARPGGAIPGFQEFQVPTPDSYPAQIAIHVQGEGFELWVSERDGNKIARFDPQAGTDPWKEYDIPTAGSKPWGLAVDGDGNVWFAETAANQIGKLNVASGLITEYAIPTLNSQPWDVAVGDGVIWFTERLGNKIGSLVPATGEITEYTLPTADAEPTGIAFFADQVCDYVWFTETAADKLGRLKTRPPDCLLTISEHAPLPPRPPLDAPQDVVAASSGNPWFTETEGNKITLFWKSTLADFTQIPVYSARSEPYGVAMEGDVAVWFTEKAVNRLGRFSGSVPPHEYRLPTPKSQPTGIVVDGDGCAWYTAPGVNQIGRLCLPVQYSVYLPLISRN